ncbi:MAG TPA: hypothetical protein VIN67_02275 [Desulfobaccales bacterium]
MEATELGFKGLKEEWNEYQADDGTVLRFKAVVTEIYRLDEYDQDSKPIYVIKSSNVLSSSVPEHLKKGAANLQ